MPDKKHNFTWTEIKAGALVTGSAIILLVFIGAMLNWQDAGVVNRFFTHFTDIEGLNVGAEVRFGGLKAGKVVGIAPDGGPDGGQSQIRVEFVMNPSVPVNAGSMAYITQRTLTSDKHLEVTTGADDAPLLAEGHVPSGVGGLFGQLAAVTENIEGLFADVRALLGVEDRLAQSGEVSATIARLLEGVDTTITESESLVKDIRGVVADSKEDIDAILEKIQEVEVTAHELVRNLNGMIGENRNDIRGTIASVRQTTDSVNGLVARVTQDLETVMETLEQTLANAEVFSGEARSVLEVNRPAFEDLILDLRETVRNLKTFARTMADQPQAIIRGRELEGRR
jgi:phospholipid/cholesterol/gamma-HCH transport system substrate-binding protein